MTISANLVVNTISFNGSGKDDPFRRVNLVSSETSEDYYVCEEITIVYGIVFGLNLLLRGL